MMNSPLKIVISGPVGAGKTTFIRSLSETAIVDTDAIATEQIGKLTTTVAMDFGTLVLDDIPVFLFGTPGQDRFDYMWEILCEGALGLMLLVAGDRPEDFFHAKHILEYVTSRIPIPFVIGVTRQDLPTVWEPIDVADFFEVDDRHVIGLNATSATSSVLALIHLLEHVEREVRVSMT